MYKTPLKTNAFAAMASAAALLLSLGTTAAQAGPNLNDTGQISCIDGAALAPCTNANSGDAAPLPRQDGRFGRGVAGFDFTLICMNGTVNCAGVDNIGPAPAATDTACTRDNHTRLMWSMHVANVEWDTDTSAAANAQARCGYSTGWRLPTARELLSIVFQSSSSPALVDSFYFPSTPAGFYWTAEPYLPAPTNAWAVDFTSGVMNHPAKTYQLYKRLVRDL